MVGTKPEAVEGLRGSSGVESGNDSVVYDSPDAQKAAPATSLNTGSKHARVIVVSCPPDVWPNRYGLERLLSGFTVPPRREAEAPRQSRG